jgi:hypothetical protein
MRMMLALCHNVPIGVAPPINEGDSFAAYASCTDEVAGLGLRSTRANGTLQIFAPKDSYSGLRDHLCVVREVLIGPELIRGATMLLQPANDELMGLSREGALRVPSRSPVIRARRLGAIVTGFWALIGLIAAT